MLKCQTNYGFQSMNYIDSKKENSNKFFEVEGSMANVSKSTNIQLYSCFYFYTV